MSRNTYRIIEETRKNLNLHYDMTQEDIKAILGHTNNFIAQMSDSFVFGYAMGLRAAEKEVNRR